jgi:O-antigen ligase
MFITGGRAGQIMFFSMIAILIFQFFNNEKIKALISVAILIPGIFFTAYQTSSIFEARVNSVISDITMFSDNQYTSTGLRITFAVNSWEIIKKNPFIGVGSGDFPAEYKKVNLINTPSLPNATNPHNMYVLILVQLGLIGLVSLLSIFYFQIKQSFLNKNRLRRDLGLALPLLFLVIMFSDSYLLGHYTTLMYIFFSSFLYKNFEKN